MSREVDGLIDCIEERVYNKPLCMNDRNEWGTVKKYGKGERKKNYGTQDSHVVPYHGAN